MQRLDVSTRERISTQAGAMNLDSGRLLLAEAVKAFGVSLAAWFLVCLGALLVQAALAAIWSASDVARLFLWFVGTFGAGMMALAGTAAACTMYLLVASWFSYRRRLEAWHRAELRAYTLAGGQQVDRQLTIKALTVQEPAHVLLVALALAAKIRAGTVSEPSVAALQGDVWLGLIKAGELSKPAAEEFGRALHQMGLIKGRTKGKAGQLATVDPGEIIDLVSSRAGRIRQLEGERPQLAAGDDESTT